MTGLAALRAGAGLTTVASSAPKFEVPELMAAALPFPGRNSKLSHIASAWLRSAPAWEGSPGCAILFATP